MKTKKILTFILVATLICSVLAFSACNDKDEEGYTLVMPDGAPAIAVACLSDKISTNDTVYTLNKKIVSSLVISDEALRSDLAIVPANLAAKMYNGEADIKLLAVVTNGNLFVLSTQDKQIESLEALAGKMVYSIGQNSVPDIIFKTLLTSKGISFKVGEEAQSGVVTIRYCGDGAEANAYLFASQEKGEEVYGVLAEPEVQKGLENDLYEVFDLQKLWAEYSDSDYQGYAQAALIARSSVCEDKEFINELLSELSKGMSVAVANPQLVESNVKSIYPQTSLQGNLSATVISRCNIDAVAMPNGRDYFETTLKAVMAINKNLVGGALPGDGFYYSAD
ncbi:MAG: hypothetical protein K2G37_01770 [Clostridia bacterium]|nr:hypothetical protein [Clostridia bacterium]MDE7328793.1 hypothetical protein [Clostridia bacterium]